MIAKQVEDCSVGEFAILLKATSCSIPGYNEGFEIVLSMPLLRHFDEGFLRSELPGYDPLEGTNVLARYG